MPKVTIDVSPQAMTALRWLTSRGLYGKDIEDVARGMLYDRLRAYYVLEHLPPAPRRRRTPRRGKSRSR